ncbi:MAG: peptidase, partial [Planctomycetota bacterium]
MNIQGYYRFPTIWEDKVVFVCEDDLWLFSQKDKQLARLTHSSAEVSRPHLKPDGKMIAFTGKDEGETEVYTLDLTTGEQKRLTYLGAFSAVVGWSRDGNDILFASDAHQPFSRIFHLYRIPAQGGEPIPLNLGIAHHISFSPNQGTILGRNTWDIARWKRYRGGTAGVLWIDREGNGNFQRFLQNIQGNLASPLWIGERIYFISDHQGQGRLYSCDLDEKDLRLEAKVEQYYIRHANTDGKNIVFQAGGDLYLHNIKTRSNQK